MIEITPKKFLRERSELLFNKKIIDFCFWKIEIFLQFGIVFEFSCLKSAQKITTLASLTELLFWDILGDF